MQPRCGCAGSLSTMFPVETDKKTSLSSDSETLIERCSCCKSGDSNTGITPGFLSGVRGEHGTVCKAPCIGASKDSHVECNHCSSFWHSSSHHALFQERGASQWLPKTLRNILWLKTQIAAASAGDGCGQRLCSLVHASIRTAPAFFSIIQSYWRIKISWQWWVNNCL